MFYLFGAFLVYTAVKLSQSNLATSDDEEYKENSRSRRLRQEAVPGHRRLPRRAASFIKIDGKRCVTPMLIVMIAIGSTDLLFALDSIPAIFGLTKEPFLVFTANAFALMGLRQLYFLLGGLLSRLVYLSIGLAVILGFIGVKLVLEALHTNALPFLNGGQPLPVPTIGHRGVPVGDRRRAGDHHGGAACSRPAATPRRPRRLPATDEVADDDRPAPGDVPTTAPVPAGGRPDSSHS